MMKLKIQILAGKYFSYFSIPTFNIGICAYAQIPSLGFIEEILKLLLLIATFIFTVVKIYLLILNELKSRKSNRITEENE